MNFTVETNDKHLANLIVKYDILNNLRNYVENKCFAIHGELISSKKILTEVVYKSDNQEKCVVFPIDLLISQITNRKYTVLDNIDLTTLTDVLDEEIERFFANCITLILNQVEVTNEQPANF